MFALKNKYFLIIESIKDINLSNIKKHNKFVIIYRTKEIKDDLAKLIAFRKECNTKKIKLYIANNLNLCILIKSDGIYLSSYNKTYKALSLKKFNFDIIGSAHDYGQIRLKINQGCDYILFSKLFDVSYDKKMRSLGVLKFRNYLNKFRKKIIPLGGINLKNLNKLRMLDCYGIALLSEIKKKPTKIFSRLF
tara:strand:+ start:521 stop:1096 length:576 start_codon:yes stop_codon:yes gene_type:complete